jgi:hypothetical protein
MFTIRGLDYKNNALLTARKADIQAFVNSGGGLLMLTQGGLSLPYSSLELPEPFTISESFAGSDTTLFQTPALAAAGFNITDQELSNGTPVHCHFLGPPGFNGLRILIVNDAEEIITLGGGSETRFGQGTNAPLLGTVALLGLCVGLGAIGVRTLTAKRARR